MCPEHPKRKRIIFARLRNELLKLRMLLNRINFQDFSNSIQILRTPGTTYDSKTSTIAVVVESYFLCILPPEIPAVVRAENRVRRTAWISWVHEPFLQRS